MNLSLFNEAPKIARAPVVLRPYQVEAGAELKKGWLGNRLGNTFRRQLVVLATGLGKTVLFSDIVRWVQSEYGGRALILAHREELLEQAEEKLVWVLGDGVAISREQGIQRASLSDQIITASVATLGRSVTAPERKEYDEKTKTWVSPKVANDRLSRFPKDFFKVIVVDEAHHSTADTYQMILNYFPDAWVLGVTATPRRTDKESLRGVYDRVAYKMDIVEGTKQGFLSPIVSHRVKSTTNIAGIKLNREGDYNLTDLAKRVNNAERNELVVETYLKHCRGQQCIIYATSVEHARALDEGLQAVGVTAYAITGDMDKTERKVAVERFKRGEIQALTNYGVLTEGFDHEKLANIINARPTKSSLLLTQIAGRLTRLSPGKTEGRFFEIIDNHADDTATAAQIFGFKQTFDCMGVNFLKCIGMCEDYEKEKDYFNPWIWRSPDEMWMRFSKATPTDPNGTGKPMDGSSEEFDPARFDSRYRYYKAAGDAFKFSHTPRESDAKYVVRLDPDGMGGFTSSITKFMSGETPIAVCTFDGNTPLVAAQAVEAFVQRNFDWDALLNLNAPWRAKARKEPCTEKQWNLIIKFRLQRGRSREDISKADAMEMISRFFNK